MGAAPTLLAVPITSAEIPLAEQVRAARAAGADLVELRVDCIGDVAAVEALLKQPRIVPLIVTVRAADEGGSWTGDDAERIALLERLGLHLPGYVDVEYATWQRSANVRQKVGLVCHAARPEGENARPRNRLILSHHDFKETPPDLDAVFDRLAATPAAVIKAVFAARDATDGCRVLEQLRRHTPTRPTIALAMGEAGVCTRILAKKFGAFLTFATLDPGGESAPGQPTIAELRNTYRWEHLGPATRVYGVLGWPVRHSLSPLVHNAALTAAGLDGVYVPLPVRPGWDDFRAFMECVTASPALDFAGFSVTLPHKEHALRWLDEWGGAVSAPARRCGAVNTLIRRPDDTWGGDNTDGRGAVMALRTLPECSADQLRGRVVSVLGAGGVARAIVAALCDAGADVTVYNRSENRAQRLASELGCRHTPWANRLHYAGDILINCTSLGLWPAVDETPLPDEALRPGTVVFDTIYQPAETRLLRAARARGCAVISGLEMFLHQAEAQFELWHGIAAPSGAMRASVASRH
jgi:3-dehydroquinate dehydratase/shikimate dehydrogenase